MARPSAYLTVTQSLLASALIFAAAIGYWSVGTFQTSSADSVTATTSSNLQLGWILIGAILVSAAVCVGLIVRHFYLHAQNDE